MGFPGFYELADTSSFRRSRLTAALFLAIARRGRRGLSAQQPAIVSGTNVNMVSGTSFPDGDPYLQRQNEPNAAVSTRNQLHLLAGANDYRTVDLPGPFDPMRGFKMSADAWVGLFKSVDGGQNWKSTLLPGFPQDETAEGLSSPIKGREGRDRPGGPLGHQRACSITPASPSTAAANRPSSIFVARFMDLNNVEAGDPFGYVDTRLVDTDTGTRFLDKVAHGRGRPAHRGDLQHHQPPAWHHPRPDHSGRATSTSPTRRSPARGRPSSR